MEFCKVTAVVRGEKIEAIEKRLIEAGASGMTVTQVTGCGEWMNFFQKDWMVSHARIEIFASGELADQIAEAIMQEAHTGEAGDGIVAILPVQQIYKIRTKAPSLAEDL